MSGETIIPKEVVETTKMSDATMFDIFCYVIKHRSEIFPLIPELRNLGRSIADAKTRSFSNDILKIQERFDDNIVLEGVNNIPIEGGTILAVSHVSNTSKFPGLKNPKANPFVWGAGLVRAVRARRGEEAEFRLIALARDGIQQQILSVYRGFPINPESLKKSKESLQRAREAVKEGDIVVISPEGETHTELRPAKPGITRVLAEGKPVVPVVFVEEGDGSNQAPFRYLIRIGEQIVPPDELFPDPDSINNAKDLKRMRMQFINRQVMPAMAALMPEEKRGAYA